jgi:hypothetical protein
VQSSSCHGQVSPAYPRAQLQSALAAVERAAQRTDNTQDQSTKEEQDAARQAAVLRVRMWTDVMQGMATGEITVGSRQPVRSLPNWVTPEVARGGFATGRPAAGGDLQPYELSLAQVAGILSNRKSLAAYYMSDAGLAYLQDMLQTGGYKARTCCNMMCARASLPGP